MNKLPSNPQDLDKKALEKELNVVGQGLTYKELGKRWPEHREKIIKREIKSSGLLDSDELIKFLKEKGAPIDPKTKNIVRFAKNNGIKMKKFGRIGKAGYDPNYFFKPDNEKINEIIKNLKNNNNSFPGRKALQEKKREIIKVFNQSNPKEESKTSIAYEVAKVTKVKTNRKLVKSVLEDEKSKSEINKKLNTAVY